jgi:HD-GYP domain-containing protein (c-di-GMP phosphodiesterase class II)
MGLHGNMIILAAKILAVADVYDAMNRDQPSGDSIPAEQVLQHLKDERGQLYDAYVVDALGRYVESPEHSPF